MKILIIFLLIIFSSKSFSREATHYLMKDSLSMFEWGMLQMESEVKDFVKQKNAEWMECHNLHWEFTSKEDKVKKIKEKNDDALTHEEQILLYDYNRNLLKFEGDMNCMKMEEFLMSM